MRVALSAASTLEADSHPLSVHLVSVRPDSACFAAKMPVLMDADSTSEAISLTLGGVEAVYAIEYELVRTDDVITNCGLFVQLQSPKDPSVCER